MGTLTQKPKKFNYKDLAIDEITPVNNEPWKVTLQKILNSHNKMVRNFNQLLAHEMTKANHPTISYGGHNYVKIGVDEISLTPINSEMMEKISKSVTHDLDAKITKIYSGPALLTDNLNEVTQKYLERNSPAPDQLLTKQLLRQFNWYCRCVGPLPVKKDAIEICKTCNKPVWDTDND